MNKMNNVTPLRHQRNRMSPTVLRAEWVGSNCSHNESHRVLSATLKAGWVGSKCAGLLGRARLGTHGSTRKQKASPWVLSAMPRAGWVGSNCQKAERVPPGFVSYAESQMGRVELLA